MPARGLALRMDHGSQYLSDHFLHQIRYWGIRPSFGFLEEPETNGVAERWNRTLKEQAIYGRVFPASRRRARRRRRFRRAVQPELAPREAWLSDADRSARGVRATPGRVAQTCVQETGCGTPPVGLADAVVAATTTTSPKLASVHHRCTTAHSSSYTFRHGGYSKCLSSAISIAAQPNTFTSSQSLFELPITED